ncbi:type II toxin-antitoxin system Phd/YefM family antitoxin [Niveispirillum cyanobacteriorum]|uniref:Antitoxin n=1 Tax=Niveispirillum cyanobacteriorum TaxID=1612173 RepID=A0A2K9NAQ5_9PROT|nr:type II toxin-antitoxin system prevent-host-death family antitoxin [Niveispirillum cyanobacteriorum]AUN30167.1 prevent-host-death protein [Niveispirillum cyanobacteriorum]GGE57312.1 antitoxin [Niveispirillum cyanobacteriorum]
MDVVNYSTARQNLAGLMDKVTQDRTPVVVTRQGAEDVILMSMSEFEGWQETVHLLSSPANAEHLRRSMEQLDAGRIVEWNPPE